MECNDPGEIFGAERHANNLSAEVTYVCTWPNVHVTGNLSRICQTNGSWSGEPPLCVEDDVERNKVIIKVFGVTLVAVIAFVAYLHFDFAKFRRRKERWREFRRTRKIQDGSSRPTSFFIPKEVLRLHISTRPRLLPPLEVVPPGVKGSTITSGSTTQEKRQPKKKTKEKVPKSHQADVTTHANPTYSVETETEPPPVTKPKRRGKNIRVKPSGTQELPYSAEISISDHAPLCPGSNHEINSPVVCPKSATAVIYNPKHDRPLPPIDLSRKKQGQGQGHAYETMSGSAGGYSAPRKAYYHEDAEENGEEYLEIPIEDRHDYNA